VLDSEGRHAQAHFGYLSLWQPEKRLQVVDDGLSDCDVGWVNLTLDGPEVAATAGRPAPAVRPGPAVLLARPRADPGRPRRSVRDRPGSRTAFGR
jgi:hypothetical protein